MCNNGSTDLVGNRRTEKSETKHKEKMGKDLSKVP